MNYQINMFSTSRLSKSGIDWKFKDKNGKMQKLPLERVYKALIDNYGDDCFKNDKINHTKESYLSSIYNILYLDGKIPLDICSTDSMVSWFTRDLWFLYASKGSLKQTIVFDEKEITFNSAVEFLDFLAPQMSIDLFNKAGISQKKLTNKNHKELLKSALELIRST